MKNACCQSCVGFSQNKGIDKMCHIACTSGSNHRYLQQVVKLFQWVVCKTVFGAVVIHACKQYFTCSSFLTFLGPGEQFFFSWILSTMRMYNPLIFHLSGVYRQNDTLRAESSG